MFLLVPAYPGSPGPTAVKRLCVCVCVSWIIVRISKDDNMVGLLSVLDQEKFSTPQPRAGAGV